MDVLPVAVLIFVIFSLDIPQPRFAEAQQADTIQFAPIPGKTSDEVIPPFPGNPDLLLGVATIAGDTGTPVRQDGADSTNVPLFPGNPDLLIGAATIPGDTGTPVRQNGGDLINVPPFPGNPDLLLGIATIPEAQQADTTQFVPIPGKASSEVIPPFPGNPDLLLDVATISGDTGTPVGQDVGNLTNVPRFPGNPDLLLGIATVPGDVGLSVGSDTSNPPPFPGNPELLVGAAETPKDVAIGQDGVSFGNESLPVGPGNSTDPPIPVDPELLLGAAIIPSEPSSVQITQGTDASNKKGSSGTRGPTADFLTNFRLPGWTASSRTDSKSSNKSLSPTEKTQDFTNDLNINPKSWEPSSTDMKNPPDTSGDPHGGSLSHTDHLHVSTQDATKTKIPPLWQEPSMLNIQNANADIKANIHRNELDIDPHVSEPKGDASPPKQLILPSGDIVDFSSPIKGPIGIDLIRNSNDASVDSPESAVVAAPKKQLEKDTEKTKTDIRSSNDKDNGVGKTEETNTKTKPVEKDNKKNKSDDKTRKEKQKKEKEKQKKKDNKKKEKPKQETKSRVPTKNQVLTQKKTQPNQHEQESTIKQEPVKQTHSFLKQPQDKKQQVLAIKQHLLKQKQKAEAMRRAAELRIQELHRTKLRLKNSFTSNTDPEVLKVFHNIGPVVSVKAPKPRTIVSKSVGQIHREGDRPSINVADRTNHLHVHKQNSEAKSRFSRMFHNMGGTVPARSTKKPKSNRIVGQIRRKEGDVPPAHLARRVGQTHILRDSGSTTTLSRLPTSRSMSNLMARPMFGSGQRTGPTLPHRSHHGFRSRLGSGWGSMRTATRGQPSVKCFVRGVFKRCRPIG